MNDIDQPKQRTLRDFLYILFRHKAMIVAVFLAVVLTITISSVTTPPTYRASAKILVKFGRENLYTPPTSQPSASQSVVDSSREEQVNSEIEILKARGLAEKVIRAIGVNTLYPDIDAPSLLHSVNFWSPLLTPHQLATLQFQKVLRVEGIKKSNIIQIDFDHGRPDVAARTVTLLIDAFLEQHVTAYKQPQDHAFFEKQTKALGKKLQSSEAGLQSFRNKSDISSLQEQKSVLLKQISDLELALSRTRAEINENRGKRETMEDGVSAPSPAEKFGKETDFNINAIGNIRNKIADLKLREQDLRSKYPDDNRLVVTVRKEIEEAERLLAADEKTYHDKEVKTIGHNMAALGQKEKSQAKDLAMYQAELYRVNSLEERLNNLERQARIDEENYQLYVRKAEEGRISDAMDARKIANISVIQPALVPITLIKPNVKLNILLSIVLGGCMGLGLAYSLDSLSHSFKTGEDVKKYLELPVLASLPRLKA